MRIVEALIERGVDTFFGIPGGPICPIFEALRLCEGATLIESRHEANAGFAAAAYYRATGRPAGVVVTAGPGATNAITGITSAYLENIPVFVLSGDVAWSSHGGRLAQNSGPEGIDVEQLYSSITRTQLRITNGRSAVSQVLAALDTALSFTQSGPVLVVLPIDKATEPAPALRLPPPLRHTTIAASDDSVRFTAKTLANAERPLLVLGAGCLKHAEWVRQLVDVLDVPFLTTPRAKGVVSEEHPRSLRTGGMAASMWARAYTSGGVDAALVLGSDLDDTSVGPTPYLSPGGTLVHVDLNPLVFNRNLPTSLGITADLAHFADEMYQIVTREGLRNGRGRALMRAVKQSSAFDVEDFRSDIDFRIPPHRAIGDLQSSAGPRARFVTDIGEHMLYALHYLVARGPQDFHIQLNLGSMGSGIAGAIGLAVADPSRPVICICGDGGMQMAGGELLTAKKLRLPIVYAIFNDSRYNMVHHGMKQIFGSTDGYETPTVDFSVWAGSMGISARIIRQGGEIDAALIESLLADGGPVVLDIRIDREQRIRGGGRVEALQHMSILSQQAEQSSL